MFVEMTMAYQAGMQEENLRKGPWLEEEDKRLIAYVALLGERRWDLIARASGLKRTGKSCRLRWLNYLRPDLKHGRMSTEEEQIILRLHERWGNKWSRIAQKLPGRTDNEIKNYWRSHLRKKAQIQEERMQDVTDNAKQDLKLIQKGNTSGQKISYEDDRSVENILGITDDSFTFASSPYETQLLDWILWLSNDQSDEVKHHGDCNGLEVCFCYPAWFSEDSDSSLWESSGSIWDTD